MLVRRFLSIDEQQYPHISAVLMCCRRSDAHRHIKGEVAATSPRCMHSTSPIMSMPCAGAPQNISTIHAGCVRAAHLYLIPDERQILRDNMALYNP